MSVLEAQAMLYKRAVTAEAARRVRTRLREEIASTAHNQLAGNLLKQGRLDAGGGKPVKQEAYARQLASKMQLHGIARQTLSAWERGATVVPAAALLASAEVLGVNVGQLVESTRDSVKARIADLEAQVSTAAPAHVDGDGQAARRPGVRPKKTRA
jgi:transcriptional regulator with XRE-family HTH domain